MRASCTMRLACIYVRGCDSGRFLVQLASPPISAILPSLSPAHVDIMMPHSGPVHCYYLVSVLLYLQDLAPDRQPREGGGVLSSETYTNLVKKYIPTVSQSTRVCGSSKRGPFYPFRRAVSIWNSIHLRPKQLF